MLQRKLQEIMAANDFHGFTSFDSSMVLKKRKVLNSDGEPIALIGDIDDWSDLFTKQDNLEKLRLYFSMIAWKLICTVYPKHEMLKEYDELIKSPEFMKNKLQKFAKDIDDISDSMGSLGHVPQYHLLANEQAPQVVVKSEPST